MKAAQLRCFDRRIRFVRSVIAPDLPALGNQNRSREASDWRSDVNRGNASLHSMRDYHGA